jgi:hypothetical protein
MLLWYKFAFLYQQAMSRISNRYDTPGKPSSENQVARTLIDFIQPDKRYTPGF